MSGSTITYIPFKYCSFTKPTYTVYENLKHLPWTSINGELITVNNIFTDLSSNTKSVHNNDETFVLRIENNSIVDTVAKYQKIIHSKFTISVQRERHLFNKDQNLKKEFLNNMDEVCEFSSISFYISNSQASSYDIVLVGYPDNIKAAENKLRIIIESFNPAIYIDQIDLGTISLLPLIGGIELNNFKQIAKQTNCHLYLPNILLSTYKMDSSYQDSKIYISGIKSQVLLTKNLIFKIKANITSPYIKNVPIDFNKKTMMLLLGYHEKILAIMYKNECFIQIPGLDSPDSVVIFQANNLELVEKSIQEFVCLLGEIYGAGCYSSDNLIHEDTDKVLLDMSSYGNCMLQVKDNQIKIIGSKLETKRTISLLSNYQPTITSLQKINRVEYSLELKNDERDFIGGKKNGKILKIMNNSNSIVKIIPYSDFSFIVELNSQTIQSSIVALKMIEDELPMSITFNIPESFHRQIIGVGGATVQTIMRRYNVFIKFSNTFVFNGTDESEKIDYNPIQSFISKSNVIIKCPLKNGSNIPYAKLEVEKLVQNCSTLNFFNTFIKLSRSHWRLLSNNSIGINNEITNLSKNSSNSTFITDLEKRTNTLIKFPKSEPTSLGLLEIKGVERNSEECARLFETLLPKDYEFKLAYNPIFKEIASFDRNSKLLIQSFNNDDEISQSIGFKFLNEITIPFKLLYNIEVQVFYDPKLENDEEDLFNYKTSINDNMGNETNYKSINWPSITSNKNFINDGRYHSSLSPNFEFFSLNNDSDIPQFHSIILSYFELEMDKSNLKKCLEILTSFLRENQIMIIDKNFNDTNSPIIDGSSIIHANQQLSINNNLELNKENMNITEQYVYQQQQQLSYAEMNPLQQKQLPQYYNNNNNNINYQQQQQQQQQTLQKKPVQQFPQIPNKNWGFQKH